ncbi:hypothetical protein N8911_02030, partial [bacterium]|nr:hypothetical protein [bacterium]
KQRIIEIHGNKYDLSRLRYINRRTKVDIVCKQHGLWKTTTEQLFRGQGCPKCGLISQGNKRRLSREEFINKCIEIHEDLYDYSNVQYQGMGGKVIIICREHGDFKQTPSSHLNGSGCPKCGLISQGNKRKLSIEDFVSRSNKIHGDRYDYSNVDYVNNFTEIEIVCSVHGVFCQRPDFHIRGSGCPKCSIIEQHEKQKKTTKEFVVDSRLVHGDLYDYSEVNYTGGKNKVTMICRTHGKFLQTPNNHLSGTGCPNCNSSRGERLVSLILNELGVQFIEQHTFRGLKMKRNLRCDFYLPDFDTVIEFNGIQHYQEREQFGGLRGLRRTQKSDKMKRDYFKLNDIKLIEIKFDNPNVKEYIITELRKIGS